MRLPSLTIPPAAIALLLALAPQGLCQSVGFIDPPPGWKPVLRQAEGRWQVSFVPDPESKKPSAAASSAPAAPQGTPGSTAKTISKEELHGQLNAGLESFDWGRALTAVPAFIALDLTPETVAHPSNPREFAAALLNGVDRRGVLQTGIALETAPYQLLAGRETSLREYQSSYWTRLLYRTSLSLATTKSGSGEDDEAQRLALGLSITLYDREDPYTDPEILAVQQRVMDQFQGRRPKASAIWDPSLSDEENMRRLNAATGVYDRDIAPLANAAYLAELERIRKSRWGRTAWNVAWAPTWLSESGHADDLRSDGAALWTTFLYGFESPALKDRVQFLAHLRYRQGEHVVSTADPELKGEQDSLFAAARFAFGRPDFNFSIEGACIRLWGGPDGDGDVYRVGGGVEKKIAGNVWLVLSAGQDFGRGGQQDELFALGSLRFGTADQARFGPPDR